MAIIPMPYSGQPVQILSSADFATSGVYFLYHEGEIVYVGQATDMRRRIGQHMYEAVKIFDAASGTPCPVASLDVTERRFIERFLPKYNQCGIAKQIRRALSLGIDNAWELAHSADIRLTHSQAATFLRVSPEQFDEMVSSGLKFRTARHGPSRTRSDPYYLVSELIRFASDRRAA